VSYFLSTPGEATLPVEIYAAIRKGFTPEINAISTIFLGVSSALVLIFVQLSNLGGKLDRH
jgi:spermidine/putrescine transport system permease protein